MNNNTVKDLDSCGNKRKRSVKENEGKTSQKKTLLSYFQSPKDKEPENGTEIQSEMPVSDNLSSTLMAEEKTSENGESENNNNIIFEKIEHEENGEEIQQNGFELKSSVNGSENLNETDAKPDVSSESPTSSSEAKIKTGEELQDNEKSTDEFKNPVNANQDPVNTDQEVLQVASQSTSAISENKVTENVNGIEIESYAMEIQISTSTFEEKANENDFHDVEQIVDVNTGPDMNQINDALTGTGNLNEVEVKPGPSRASQASTSGENSSDAEDNQENIEGVDEEKEPEDLNHLSSPSTSKPKSAIIDWRSSCNDVASLPNKARKEGLFTDIKFVMGDGEKRKIFQAHKSILACASPVFEEMFFGASPDQRTIIETDDDPDAFEMLLEYIYGERFYINATKSLTSVCKFYVIGNKYLVPEVQKAFNDFISIGSISESDFWDILQANNFDSLGSLFCDKLKCFIMENIEQLVSSEKFLNVPKTIIDNILQMNKLNIEEHLLLIAVTQWVYHNNDQVTSEILLEYYKHIRFSTISNDKLMQFIDLYPKALDAETCLQILQHMHKSYEHALPEWCTTKKKSRIQAFQSCSRNGPGCSCYFCDDFSTCEEDEDDFDEDNFIDEADFDEDGLSNFYDSDNNDDDDDVNSDDDDINSDDDSCFLI